MKSNIGQKNHRLHQLREDRLLQFADKMDAFQRRYIRNMYEHMDAE